MRGVIFVDLFRGYLGLLIDLVVGCLRLQLLFLEGQLVNKLGRLVQMMEVRLLGKHHDRAQTDPRAISFPARRWPVVLAG